MALKSRNKGKRGEREVVSIARLHGLPAERTWHTAQSPNAADRCCDVTLAGLKVQVKLAANGFHTLYSALEGVDVACVRCDRREWLAVLSLEVLLNLLAAQQKLAA